MGFPTWQRRCNRGDNSISGGAEFLDIVDFSLARSYRDQVRYELTKAQREIVWKIMRGAIRASRKTTLPCPETFGQQARQSLFVLGGDDGGMTQRGVHRHSAK